MNISELTRKSLPIGALYPDGFAKKGKLGAVTEEIDGRSLLLLDFEDLDDIDSQLAMTLLSSLQKAKAAEVNNGVMWALKGLNDTVYERVLSALQALDTATAIRFSDEAQLLYASQISNETFQAAKELTVDEGYFTVYSLSRSFRIQKETIRPRLKLLSSIGAVGFCGLLPRSRGGGPPQSLFRAITDQDLE